MNERFVSHIEGQPAIYDPVAIDNSSSGEQELAIATQDKQGETA
jgi:tetrathionate reductase subunit B